ncbi:MAG: 4-(cytidine 5'-diphospho)-2-C-methyl-D-erythritol kinase [Flavobacteriales bacterium]|nr:4-(cytidine 5'-diphospho)-2-C-methyl-D-erythritol kinase [Flavobacteriales bacterium]
MLVFPNAKINIGLHVTEKRADGFHNIESIFYPVMQLFDALEIVQSNRLTFQSTGIPIPGNEEDNLCLKAFKLLHADYNIPPVSIHLHKVIPIGAGLGGGSADAAFAIKALNDLFELGLTVEQMQNYARKLGSDCAFFIENKPVFAYNKGDEFEAVDLDLSGYSIRIEYPGIHISTAEAYGGIKPDFSKHQLKELIREDPRHWKQHIRNDFEKSVFPNHPEIEALKTKLYGDGAIYASMTGSGSAVFGIF